METKFTNEAQEMADLTLSLYSTCYERECNLAKIHGLTPVELKCLRLFKAGIITNNKKIADKMSLSPSRLTRIIDRLVAKGYINREIDASDRRNMRVSLSNDGNFFMQKLNEDYIKIHCQMLEDISEDCHSIIHEVFQKLFKSMENLVLNSE